MKGWRKGDGGERDGYDRFEDGGDDVDVCCSSFVGEELHLVASTEKDDVTREVSHLPDNGGEGLFDEPARLVDGDSRKSKVGGADLRFERMVGAGGSGVRVGILNDELRVE